MRTLSAFTLLFAALLAPASVKSQEPSAYPKAMAAAARGEHGTAADLLAGIAAGLPEHPFLLLQLAQQQARAGRAGEAAATLVQLLDLGGGLDADRDSAFVPHWRSPAFAAARARHAERSRPVGASAVAFRLAERDLIPEGIAWDPGTRRFLLGSINKGKIVQVDERGRASTFVPRGRLPLPVVLGLKVDPARRAVWAATVSTVARDPVPGRGRSALVEIDADRGTVRRVIAAGDSANPRFFNDVAVTRAGDVYVSDTEAGGVWLLRAGSAGAGGPADTLEPVGRMGERAFANGIALSPDERLLYVADGMGLAVIDRATGAAAAMPAPPRTALAGTDGLTADAHGLIAVQNFAGMARVVRLRLSADGRAVTALEVLEHATPHLAMPTTGTLADGGYWFIANSHVTSATPDGRYPPPARLTAPVVLHIPEARLAAAAPVPDAGGLDSVRVNSRWRRFELHLPAEYTRGAGGAGMPLLLAFHGAGGTASGFRRATAFDEESDRRQFAVAYLQADEGSERLWSLGCRRCTPAAANGVDDIAFARAVVDRVAERAPLDRARVYAAGFSMGGSMVFALGCFASDVVAGIAVVGMTTVDSLEDVCRPARPGPLRLFVGTADPFTPWEGGMRGRYTVIPPAATGRTWAARIGCAAEPAVDSVAARDGSGQVVRRYAWRDGCRVPAGVVVYRIEGGNHTWPFHDVSATREIAEAWFGP
jgi:poly(3-hydroxybutyrate) depolymerase/sugar lactone lactonase YvrE